MDVIDRQLDRLRNKLEGKIDFEGQELAEQYQRQILWVSGAIAFLVGVVLQSLQVLLIIFAIGFLLCLAVTAPSYPSYNQHPINWLPTLNKYGLAEEGEDDTAKGGSETSIDKDTEDKKDR
ncbi:hypothetical protein JCM3765_002323 [Sporobolomyces pararoseus]